MSDPRQARPIRSYVLRTGRMTPGQQRAFDEHWARWGLEHADGALDFERAFGRGGPRVLEIGFGMGQSLVTMAAAAPTTNFVGVEVHRPGVGRLLHSMADQGVDNIRVYCHDAVEVLRDCIAPESLDGIQIFFPDPWHKKRHHKRRLIQPPFVELLVSRMAPGGLLHLATDWENYAEQMLEVLSACAALRNQAGPGQYSPRPDSRPLTKFEQRGERLGHGVWDLLFTRA
ncbi:tRNA (guanosine(46)-N7)-methyltransferase TrmB [Mangrovimicrobium sediminis]|uniref:tRNA (guanine-N(7)-)-methyltransferase n=1 Tax=Mangrovimicrobium sediminis TaxID=2562682 RepID=A0A4Z0LZC1_9GAMM|nr:tRNA (guanosine(46)-N7)-methyltransferase TrmB [Haliea sp. SAOS-164]TGD72733.1 tRNA (guanosine(46)-N7)-methyltransferase TrmB [Haliea sp. SAOS-164]